MADLKTLYGSDKLREMYPKVNENFKNINNDTNNLRQKVNEIITTPIDGEAAAQELVDARDGESTLGVRLERDKDVVERHMADYASKFPDNTGAHNAIFRGKDLGSTPDYASIADGSFEDIYVGDIYTVNGRTYRIAVINYYRNTGDALVSGNHLVLVPDAPLYSHTMNDTNTTDGGYTGSKMYLEGLEQAKTIINNDFPGHVVTMRAYLCNATSDGKASAGGWVDSTVDLMNEIMVYGSVVNGHSTYGLYNIGTEKSQLPLFALNPQSINTRYSYWLRDIASVAFFATVHGNGSAYRNAASVSLAVRPRFLIS